MTSKSKTTHPQGEPHSDRNLPTSSLIPIDTYDGKLHIEWDSEAPVTPIGQLPFFIQFLKLGGRFDRWVDQCPLNYTSNNAPQKVDVLGSLFLSVLSGHH